MLEPIRNGQNVALIQEFADQQLFRCGIPDPAVDVLGEFEGRNIAVSVDFKRFESDRAVPFLSARRQQLLRRVREHRDVAQKENVSIAAERSLVRKRWKQLL